MSYKEIRREKKKQELAERCKGKYLYQNITASDVVLTVPLEDGRKVIPPLGDFIGNGLYRSMVPSMLKIKRTLEDPNAKPAPEAKKELDELLDLGEDVEIAPDVEVEDEEPGDRPELTKALLEDLRVQKAMSWSKIASETGYSITFIRKRCKQFDMA